jgi:hypothetical protein
MPPQPPLLVATATAAAGLCCACPPPAPSDRPPEQCRTPAPLPEDGWFTDVSDDWGLRSLGVAGNRLSVGDFDDDGRPDMAVAASDARLRDDFAAEPPFRQRFLLRNVDGAGFEDASESSGLSQTRDGTPGAGRSWSYALWGDVDDDGDTDAVTVLHSWDDEPDFPDLGDRSEVMLNQGDGTFAFSELSDLQEHFRRSTAASLLDADRDGRLDLWTGNQYTTFGYPNTAQQDELFLGGGDGTMDDETEDSGLETVSGGNNPDNYDADMGAHVRWPSFGSLACDVDRDGDTDLFGLTYGRGLNQFWENQGDGSYVNRTAESRFHSDDNHDVSNDQRWLCYCRDIAPGEPACDGAALPQVDCGSLGYFQPGWDDREHRLGGNTFSATCADLDGDGDLDIPTAEIRHWWAGNASDASDILWNDGGSPPVFERRDRAEIGIERVHESVDWDEGDLTVAALDFDNDGVTDLLRPQSDYPGTRLHLYRGLGGGTFEEVAERAGIDFPRAAGMAVADFDGDGDLDIATSFSRMRCDAACEYATAEVHLFRNDVGQDGNTLRIKLLGSAEPGGSGPGSNRSGIGAQVSVSAGGRTQVQELLAGFGHEGVQNEGVLHFGLGELCRAESVEVRWLDGDGTTESWTDLPANWDVELREGDETPAWRDWAGED